MKTNFKKCINWVINFLDNILESLERKTISILEEIRRKCSHFQERLRQHHSIYSNKDRNRMKAWNKFIPKIKEQLKDHFNNNFVVSSNLEQGEIDCSYKSEGDISLSINKEEGEKEGKVEISATKNGTKHFSLEYWITALPKVSMAEVAYRQYDIEKRILEKVPDVIAKELNENYEKLLSEAVKLNKNSIKIKNLKDFLKRENKAINVYILHTNTKNKLSDANFFSQKDSPDRNLFICNDFFKEDIIYGMPKFIINNKIRVDLTVLPADGFIFAKPYYGSLFAYMLSTSINDIKNIYCFKLN